MVGGVAVNLLANALVTSEQLLEAVAARGLVDGVSPATPFQSLGDLSGDRFVAFAELRLARCTNFTRKPPGSEQGRGSQRDGGPTRGVECQAAGRAPRGEENTCPHETALERLSARAQGARCFGAPSLALSFVFFGAPKRRKETRFQGADMVTMPALGARCERVQLPNLGDELFVFFVFAHRLGASQVQFAFFGFREAREGFRLPHAGGAFLSQVALSIASRGTGATAEASLGALSGLLQAL